MEIKVTLEKMRHFSRVPHSSKDAASFQVGCISPSVVHISNCAVFFILDPLFQECHTFPVCRNFPSLMHLSKCAVHFLKSGAFFHVWRIFPSVSHLSK